MEVMKSLEKEGDKLRLKLLSYEKKVIDKKFLRDLVDFLLKVISKVEEGKISETQADYLFGFFMENADLLPEKLEEIIFDGGSLELTPEQLGSRIEKVNVKSIKERLLKEKSLLAKDS